MSSLRRFIYRYVCYIMSIDVSLYIGPIQNIRFINSTKNRHFMSTDYKGGFPNFDPNEVSEFATS